MNDRQAVLRIRNLKTYFGGKKNIVKAVDGVDLDVWPGRITALVGGSGSGKSVISRSVLNLIEPPGKIVEGQVFLDDRDLLTLSEKEMRKIRGKDIAMIFQEPTCAMNPVVKVKDHLFEAVHIHNRGIKKKDSQENFRRVLNQVGLNDPDRILESYPFELSGGMCQRVMVAMGILENARILIADEPTSSLDLTTQLAILDELIRLKEEGMGIILITHDLGVVAQTADDMYVIKDGKIVEYGNVEKVFRNPQHTYTQYLMEPLDIRK